MKAKQFKIENKLAMYVHLDKNEIWIYLPPKAEIISEGEGERARKIVKIKYAKESLLKKILK